MASDVLQDLMKALCSLSIVEPVPAKRSAAGSAPAPRSAASERREASTQEAA